MEENECHSALHVFRDSVLRPSSHENGDSEPTENGDSEPLGIVSFFQWSAASERWKLENMVQCITHFQRWRTPSLKMENVEFFVIRTGRDF